MIICDTNIWYDLGEGRISYPREPLVCTYTSIREIGCKKDIRKARRAISAINEFASVFYFEDAFSMMLRKLGFTSQMNLPSGKMRVWEQLKSILNLTEDQITEIDNKIKEDLKADHFIESPLFLDAKKATEEVNDLLTQVKANIKKNKLKSYRLTEDTTEQTKQLMVSCLNCYLEEKRMDPINIEPSNSKWSTLELIVEAWSDFCKKLELNKNNKKITLNDFSDLWNMAYVGSSDLYWTVDTEWPQIMKANPKLNKYLFQLN